jgi:hypothetical protein
MSLVRRNRPIDSREQLSRYLDQNDGLTSGYLDIKQDHTYLMGENDGEEYPVRYREEQRPKGCFIAGEDEETGEPLIYFLPNSWRNGNSLPDEPPYVLTAEDQLPIDGVRFVVQSRRPVSPVPQFDWAE